MVNSYGIIYFLEPEGEFQHTVLCVKGIKANMWSFPKGRIKKTDKDIWQCAIREAREETGLEFEITDKNVALHKKQVYLFHAKIVGGVMNTEPTEEISEVAWLDLLDLNLTQLNLALRVFSEKLIMDLIKSYEFDNHSTRHELIKKSLERRSWYFL